MADGDGASEGSYESVASDGGYEAATDRGREQYPRIISSSNCVEVFQRVNWSEHFNYRTISRDEKEKIAKARGIPIPFSPLDDLPKHLYRFDGAMEAWLEELPLSKNAVQVDPYTSLSEVAARRPELSVLQEGNKLATIWYFNIDFFAKFFPKLFYYSDVHQRQHNPDFSFWVVQWAMLLRDSCMTIEQTHTEVGKVHYPPNQKRREREKWLKSLFSALQTSKWTPNGEARKITQAQKLCHASMSVGDAVQLGGELYFVTLTGFFSIPEELALPILEGLIPADLGAYTVLEPDDEPSPTAKEQKKAKNKKPKGQGKGKEDNTNGHDENGVLNVKDDGPEVNGIKGQGGRKNRKRPKGKGKDGNQDDSWKSQDDSWKNQDDSWQDNSWKENSWQDNAWHDNSWKENYWSSWQDNSWQGNGWEEPPPKSGKGKRGKGGKSGGKVDDKVKGGKGGKGDNGAKGGRAALWNQRGTPYKMS